VGAEQATESTAGGLNHRLDLNRLALQHVWRPHLVWAQTAGRRGLGCPGGGLAVHATPEATLSRKVLPRRLGPCCTRSTSVFK
jgi:hypothetical protein